MPVRGVAATYYTVLDIDKLTAFYSGVTGAQPETSMPGRLSEWVFEDGSSFGLYRAEGKEAARSGSVMFAVDDAAAAVAHAKSLGASFDSGHGDEVTQTPVCRMAFAYDPEGNQFILHQRL